ncbi:MULTISPECIES: TetR family transcriptional regulator [unclassified Microbacterium]|uniref:TetR/AcrR family transcriptional regulator n=1 Tax=unclassified Microbacterium TaxID=2609290 RepID=UPI00214C3089|nr:MULTISPECIES: TetR family transcriptional regulator [unclassified Microbacterium]MCR2810687.1 TetR family transcriptional regulator [Microbacterium sp. zg.B185]WIM18224.1 TetR family transcriptional regulator [Microbacterium sp. zg-B185]
MSRTREQALNAAVALIGDQGIRALTHARVDERAGLPKGSTSNWFRTRDALLAGVIAWIAESERRDFAQAAADPIDTPERLIDAFTGMIGAETGRFAGRTRARYALFLEAGTDRGLLAPLLAQRAAFHEWIRALLTAIGTADPGESTRALMAGLEGVVLHRLTVDPDAEIRPLVSRIVRGAIS